MPVPQSKSPSRQLTLAIGEKAKGGGWATDAPEEEADLLQERVGADGIAPRSARILLLVVVDAGPSVME